MTSWSSWGPGKETRKHRPLWSYADKEQSIPRSWHDAVKQNGLKHRLKQGTAVLLPWQQLIIRERRKPWGSCSSSCWLWCNKPDTGGSFICADWNCQLCFNEQLMYFHLRDNNRKEPCHPAHSPLHVLSLLQEFGKYEKMGNVGTRCRLS